MSARVAELEERRLQALRDLAELEDQVDAGEIDAATADRLRRTYEADAAAAIEALAAEREEVGHEEPGGPPGRRPRARTLLVAAALVAAVAGGGLLLADQLSPRPDGGFVTGNLPATATGDVSTDELEEVVAANPDVVGMRLALADRHFDAGDVEAAYEHYWEALQREPDPHALARLGWIVAEQGEPELGAALLEESLERRPDHPEAMFLLASIHLQLGDTGAAHELLTRLVGQDGLAPEDERLVADLLAELDAAGDAP